MLFSLLPSGCREAANCLY